MSMTTAPKTYDMILSTVFPYPLRNIEMRERGREGKRAWRREGESVNERGSVTGREGHTWEGERECGRAKGSVGGREGIWGGKREVGSGREGAWQKERERGREGGRERGKEKRGREGRREGGREGAVGKREAGRKKKAHSVSCSL